MSFRIVRALSLLNRTYIPEFLPPPNPFLNLTFYFYAWLTRATCRLIREGTAIPYTAHAKPPTVTMPRVKGITTGSTPTFLDVILNFAESDTTSTLANQDTWLAQIKANAKANANDADSKSDDEGKGKLVFYGDDTWLKLFPGMFARHDGTTSFFVSVSGYLVASMNEMVTELLWFFCQLGFYGGG